MIDAQLLRQNVAFEPRLLAGPPMSHRAESYAAHTGRLGARPRGGEWIISILEESGLRGRGGAWFPTYRKLQRARERGGSDVLVINGSEGEPLSGKDRLLLDNRPHLVLDGAQILAETLGAGQIVVYVAKPARHTADGLRTAMAERRRSRELPVRIVQTAHRYVAGESSAVRNRVLGGPSKPTGKSQSDVTVQNVETAVHVALIARRGADWFRQWGTDAAPGTALLTVSGAVQTPGVFEVPVGMTVSEVVRDFGGGFSQLPSAALAGGYAGVWLGARDLHGTEVSPEAGTIGCGILAVAPQRACGLQISAAIARYLAREGAGQCGPCVFGLPAIADAVEAIASGTGDRGDLYRLRRWCDQVEGRGACHHPDGAARMIRSALQVFETDVERHLGGDICGFAHGGFPHVPKHHRGWR
jgi:NADH:ubiquinone oxidoreductase subunit F (NADH-binding)